MLTFTTVKCKLGCYEVKNAIVICESSRTWFATYIHIWYNSLNAILKILYELWIFWFGGGKVYFRHPYLIEIGYSQSPFFAIFESIDENHFLKNSDCSELRLQGYEPASIFQHRFHRKNFHNKKCCNMP